MLQSPGDVYMPQYTGWLGDHVMASRLLAANPSHEKMPNYSEMQLKEHKSCEIC